MHHFFNFIHSEKNVPNFYGLLKGLTKYQKSFEDVLVHLDVKIYYFTYLTIKFHKIWTIVFKEFKTYIEGTTFLSSTVTCGTRSTSLLLWSTTSYEGTKMILVKNYTLYLEISYLTFQTYSLSRKGPSINNIPF